MNRILTISAIAIIAAVMVIGVVSPAMANNGGDACEKASPKAKGCDNNPNSTTTNTCETCNAEYHERNLVCTEEFGGTIAEFECFTASHEELKQCVKPVSRTCQIPPPTAP